MTGDEAVRRLVGILTPFFTHNRPVEEDLRYSITSEFLRNMQDVLFTKQMFLNAESEISFWEDVNRSLLSAETYLNYLIYACRRICLVTPKICERFLNVFALILFVSGETNAATYRNLIPDLFMVVYENEIKKPFFKCGGFRRLVEYVNNPGFLNRVCLVRNICEFYHPGIAFDEVEVPSSEGEFIKTMRRHVELPKFDFQEAESNKTSLILAKKVLEVTHAKSPTGPTEVLPLPSGVNSVSIFENLVQQNMTQLENIKTGMNRLGEMLKSGPTSIQTKIPTLLSEVLPLPSDKNSSLSLPDFLQRKKVQLEKVDNLKEVPESSPPSAQVEFPTLLSEVLPSPSNKGSNLNHPCLPLEKNAQFKKEQNILEKIGDADQISECSPALNSGSKTDNDTEGQINNGSNLNLPRLLPQKNAEFKKGQNFLGKIGDSDQISECSSALNSGSKTEDDSEGQMDDEWYEKIIESVIKHNHSKSSSHSRSPGRIQMEASGILEHLKGMIQSLIQVLDDSDKE